MAVRTIDHRPPGNILPMTMLGTTWATCVTPRVKAEQEAEWLLPLSGIVCVLDIFGRLHDARAGDDVRELVGLYRASGVYDPAGRFRLAWWFGDGAGRIGLLKRLFFTLAQRQVDDLARRVKMDELLDQLRRTVRTVEARLA